MQAISISHVEATRVSRVQTSSIPARIEKLVSLAEENHFAVVATLILLQVTIAGFNVVIPPMVGASVFLMAPGIVLAFLSNGIALAQAPMRWVLAGFALSI